MALLAYIKKVGIAAELYKSTGIVGGLSASLDVHTSSVVKSLMVWAKKKTVLTVDIDMSGRWWTSSDSVIRVQQFRWLCSPED